MPIFLKYGIRLSKNFNKELNINGYVKPFLIGLLNPKDDLEKYNSNDYTCLKLDILDDHLRVIDKELINKIGDGEQISLAGKTKLCHLIELFSRADLVIAPDSGSAHLAWASGKPNLIEIFCCTGTNFFGCFGNPKKYFTVQDNLPCQPCNKRKCRFDSDECTKFPPADEVIKIAENLLEQE